MQRPIGGLMTTKVVTVDPDCPVVNVLKKLHTYRISCVVVCEEGVPVGIISERDVVGLAYDHAAGRAELPETVRGLVTGSVITASPDDDFSVAVDRMTEQRVRHLPIVDEAGALVGLVTQSDLLRTALRQLASRAR